MSCFYQSSKDGEIQYRNLYCYVDDGFGNLWEIAGSYYDDRPDATLLHSGMMRVNRVGALYHLGLAQLNQDGFADGFH